MSSMPLIVLLALAIIVDEGATGVFVYFAATGMLAAGAMAMKKRQATCLVPLIPYFTVLAMFHFDDSSPVKPFGRFYLAIKTGMKEEDVMKAMEREFPSGGKYPRPFVLRQLDGNYLGFILDPHNWRYNAEIVAVHFRDGDVVTKDYSAD